ncbi:hypothetical protein PAAG_01211 [Paracoccidioides lutzii Pb01]|uniref:Cell division cycle protein 123 n=1 Tax=Paracoccidioides lutzii (strain ATCC MYA-826 / Pb01) TaxID=502779 RepID=C1GRR6_PARBA|nr:hypothetical protein PAAG_01211 [Paracoccidioides lutzii Pb01]EEH38290.2 hypothetical protein PAAG_01211 [Paracoccidioides lutzii Pb01]
MSFEEGGTLALTVFPHYHLTLLVGFSNDPTMNTNMCCNSHSHTHEQICAVIPEEPGRKHENAMPNVERYSHWAKAIMNQNGYDEWHVFELPKLVIEEIIEANYHWLVEDKADETRIAYIAAHFPKTMSDMPIDFVFRPGKKWFCRLDLTNPTDELEQKLPVTSLEELVWRLCTSSLAHGALLIDVERQPKLFLIPFDDMIRQSLEFRAFCPPGSPQVTAVSQRHWLTPFPNGTIENMIWLAKVVLQCANRLRNEIVEYSMQIPDRTVSHDIHTRGFVFDFLLTPGMEGRLVDINGFGAMGGTGSCLFNWIRDAHVLYGLKTYVEIRVSTAIMPADYKVNQEATTTQPKDADKDADMDADMDADKDADKNTDAVAESKEAGKNRVL